MKIVFAGTPAFACAALARLHATGFDIALVLTQPDRPAGRGMKLQASAVKQFALAHGIAVAQPRSLRLDGKYPEDAEAARAALAAAQADAMVVAAYGLILPQWVLDTPRLGCFNIHASLLPRWRGAAPIHRAIEAGDTQTGVTIMQMDAGLDTGDMLLAEPLAIGCDDTTTRLHDRLASLGAQMIVQALELAAQGGLQPIVQPTEGVTYAHKIEKDEAAIDWAQTAAVIERRVRAFDPFPGAQAVLAGETLKLWAAQAHCAGAVSVPVAAAGAATSAPTPGEALPGQVLAVGDAGIAVQTGGGTLLVTELQRPGGKRLPVGEFLRGHRFEVGQVFEPLAARGPR